MTDPAKKYVWLNVPTAQAIAGVLGMEVFPTLRERRALYIALQEAIKITQNARAEK